MDVRIGQGIDIHPFVTGRPLVLGGVTIPHSKGLAGHSDADALSHAICDALLGTLAFGDIGTHFPDKDPANRNRPSSDFLKHAVDLIEHEGWEIANIDATIVTEEPTLRPYIEGMRRSLAEILGIFPDQVSVKATRPEKLGSLGRGEGLTAMAIALIER
ncbi:MAG: 2-C-methyl-D-erythritol 2,4-cyclodiphosphate synthase [Pseudomonadota bacterium]